MTIKKQDNFFFYIPNQEGKHYMNAQKESLNNAADQFNTKARGFYLANYQKNAPFSRVYKHCSLGSALSSILCSKVFCTICA